MLVQSSLNEKVFSLKLKGKLYATCVSCLMYGSETRPMKAEHEMGMIIDQSEMNMIRWMYAMKLKKRTRGTERIGTT